MELTFAKNPRNNVYERMGTAFAWYANVKQLNRYIIAKQR